MGSMSEINLILHLRSIIRELDMVIDEIIEHLAHSGEGEE